MDDYDIKEKAFSKYIPEAPVEGENYVNSLGLTFIFIQKEKGMLPKYCGSIVELDNLRRVSNRYNLLSHETLSKLAGGKDSSTTTDDIIEYTHFNNKYIFSKGTGYDPEAEFNLAYRRLSSIYYTRVAENGKVPSLVTLFELYQDIYHLSSDAIQGDGLREVLRSNWTKLKEKDPTTPKNDVTKNLSVAMGKNEHGITYLDLHNGGRIGGRGAHIERLSETVGASYLEDELLGLSSNVWTTPLVSSNTQSAFTSDSGGGRPTAEETGSTVGEAGEKTRDNDSNQNR